MTYTLAGFTFTLNLDGSGNVVSIVTPNLSPLFPSTEIAFNPAVTVDQAKATIAALLIALGLL